MLSEYKLPFERISLLELSKNNVSCIECCFRVLTFPASNKIQSPRLKLLQFCLKRLKENKDWVLKVLFSFDPVWLGLFWCFFGVSSVWLGFFVCLVVCLFVGGFLGGFLRGRLRFFGGFFVFWLVGVFLI